ncbi:MAG: uracil-DNA glycosylase [Carnobacterium maltaromaticum]
MEPIIGNDWDTYLENEYRKEYFRELQEFLAKEYNEKTIFPPKKEIYTAFQLTSRENTAVVLIGQDPYHGALQAHGLSFSIADERAKFPPSLRNIFKELQSDLGIERINKNLTDWAMQGVLMLNTVLTVEESAAGSHRKHGWEQFTDAVIKTINQKGEQVIFILWGNDAKKKADLITNPLHKIIESAHPSPLAVRHGFFGSKPFSKVNQYLEGIGKSGINW